MFAGERMVRRTIVPNAYLIGGAIFVALAAVTVIAGFVVRRD
jgi:hypothetical protein